MRQSVGQKEIQHKLDGWKSLLLALAVGLGLLAAIFFREIDAAVEVWNASTAYSHCYLVLPMAVYLLWERRDVVARTMARPELVWVWLGIPVSLAWLCAERLGLMEGRQLAAIAGGQVLLLTLLGRRMYRRLSGPLLFLFFLVPFGAFLTPLLQRFTAAFTITGLDLLAIPNYSDRFLIETQAGLFFVAEACAGLRFLVAAFAFGVFYSLLTYTDIKRRLAFIALSIVVPIVANGFRALGIVVLGQFLGSAQAAAADHLVYGWVFFSVVMVLLIGVGQLLRGGEAEAPLLPIDPPGGRAGGWPAVAAGLAVLSLGIGPAVAAMIDLRSAAPALTLERVVEVPPGCTEGPSEGRGQPNRQQSVIDCGEARFVVLVETFAPRSTSSAMVTERRRVTQEIGAENVSTAPVENAPGAGDWTLVQTTDPNRVTAYASWVDGASIGQGLAGRVAQARNSLFGAAFAPMLVMISTAEPERSPPAARAAMLDQFRALLRAQRGIDQRVERLTRLASSQ